MRGIGRSARCRAALGGALALAGMAGQATAADWPLEEQFPLDYVVVEDASSIAESQLIAADVAAGRLRDQVARDEQAVDRALDALREAGGDEAASRIASERDTAGQLRGAERLRSAADSPLGQFAIVTPEMIPALNTLLTALRRLNDGKEQLADAERRLEEARKAAEAAKPPDPPLQLRWSYIDPGWNIRIDPFLSPEGKIDVGAPPAGDRPRIEYYTPQFRGFQFDYRAAPETAPETASPPEPEPRTVPDAAETSRQAGQIRLDLGYDYFRGDWRLTPNAAFPELPADSGVPRTSQAQAGPLTDVAARLGDDAFPADRFFKTRGSWGRDLDDQWGLKRIGFEAVSVADMQDALWPTSGVPVIVAVLDTGIDRGHPELAGAIAINAEEVFGNGRDDDGNGHVDDVFGWNFVADSFDTWDDNGHGTFVAGIIAARTNNGLGIAGVNPYARILPVKVTDHKHASGSKLIAKGLRYAVDRGARVINISIGGPTLTGEEAEAVEYALSKGAVVVVAAGNLGVDTADFGPAGTGGVITVAATGPDDARLGFSNWGRAVDIAAPGFDILSLRAVDTDMIAAADQSYTPGSAFVGGAADYYVASGTSFAAPFVSGVASLLFSIDPSLTGAEVKRMILQSARDIGAPGIDQETGYGLLDARAALTADPAFFIEAAFTGLEAVQHGREVVVRVSGIADADQPGAYWLEIGQGEAPTRWQRVSDEIRGAVKGAVLADIPAQRFGGSAVWTLRLVVRHAGGRTREVQHVLRLG